MENKYRTIHTTSPKITGLLSAESSVYKCSFRAEKGEYLETEMSSKFLAGIVRSLDESRDQFSSEWVGDVYEETEGYRVNFFQNYEGVKDEEKLPPRSAFLTDNYDEDPYDILREPGMFSFEGRPEISWEIVRSSL